MATFFFNDNSYGNSGVTEKGNKKGQGGSFIVYNSSKSNCINKIVVKAIA